MDKLANFITNPELMIMVMAALGSFVTILAIGLQVFQKNNLDDRLKSVKERRLELSNLQREELNRKRQQPSKKVDFMKAVLEKLNMQDLIATKEVKMRLSQAGYRGQNAAISFGFARLALPVVLVLGALLFLSTAKDVQFSLMAKIVVLAGLGGIGYYLPTIFLSNSISKRQQLITRAFPDALDLLTICVEAGLSIEAAFSRVSVEMAENNAEIAEEFGLTTAELAFLGNRHAAFENLATRTGLEATKSLSTALGQSEKYGTPVSAALKVLSEDNRQHRMSLAEKKAGALPAQLTVPMIVFFLPVLFVVILG
ncbi:MAG: hypothetical protein A2516_01270, partial [Alphaproteobacteria bacterium RIFOXYD12_FULL_60_8]